MFYRELRKNVKYKLIFDERINDILEEFILTVIDIDNKLYKLAIEKRYNNLDGGVEIYYGGSEYRGGSKF